MNVSASLQSKMIGRQCASKPRKLMWSRHEAMWSWPLPRWLGRVGLCHKLPVPSCGDTSRVEAFGERPRFDAPCGQRLCDVEANAFEVAHRHDALIRYDNAGFHFHDKKTLHLSICSRHFNVQSKNSVACEH